MDEIYREKSWTILQKGWYRIMKWHFFYFKKKYSHLSKTSENYKFKIQEFLCYNTKLRSKYNFELNSIANMYETPLYLNMSPSTPKQIIG